MFICSVCEEMCSSKKGLIQHINEKHAIECSETGYHICSLCREVQSSCDELNLHFHQEHKVPLDHECNKCNKKFSTKLFLTIHTMELHEFDLDSNSMTNNISIATALNIKDVKVIEDKVEQQEGLEEVVEMAKEDISANLEAEVNVVEAEDENETGEEKQTDLSEATNTENDDEREDKKDEDFNQTDSDEGGKITLALVGK